MKTTLKKSLFACAIGLLFAANAQAQFSGNGLHRGLRVLVDASVGVDLEDSENASIGGSAAVGYQFGRHFFLGGGIGLDYFKDYEWNIVPLFGMARYDFIDSKVTPFIEGRLGYAPFDIDGYYAQIGGGVRFRLKSNVVKALNLGVGYRDFTRAGTWDPEAPEITSFHAMIGIEF